MNEYKANCNLRLWLDDFLQPPNNTWTWVLTAEECIAWLKTGLVEEMSLDHDLGNSYPEGASGATGYTVCLWLEKNPEFLPTASVVHSQNPVGAAKMRVVLNKLYDSRETQ